MTRTAEQIQADMARIRARKVAGVAEARHGDRSVKFVDAAADDRALADLEEELALAQGAPLRTRISYRRVVLRRC
jgi:hypothetical protein